MMKIIKKTILTRAKIVLALVLVLPLCPVDSGLLWLVNPDNRLESTYKPDNLASINSYRLRPEAKKAYEKMLVDMKKADIRNLILQSAYRPYNYQQVLFSEKLKALYSLGYTETESQKLAAQAVAPAGASEHQLGLAIDISIDGQLNARFGDTKAGIWIENNCHLYGFILRYPKEKIGITKIMYEPWHLRYVGIPHSTIMYENRLCLEEYIAYLQKVKMVMCWIDDNAYYKISYLSHLTENIDALDISSLGPRLDGFIITQHRAYLK